MPVAGTSGQFFYFSDLKNNQASNIIADRRLSFSDTEPNVLKYMHDLRDANTLSTMTLSLFFFKAIVKLRGLYVY